MNYIPQQLNNIKFYLTEFLLRKSISMGSHSLLNLSISETLFTNSCNGMLRICPWQSTPFYLRSRKQKMIISRITPYWREFNKKGNDNSEGDKFSAFFKAGMCNVIKCMYQIGQGTKLYVYLLMEYTVRKFCIKLPLHAPWIRNCKKPLFRML